MLREAMRRSGLDAVLHERLHEDTVAYRAHVVDKLYASQRRAGDTRPGAVAAVSEPIWDGLRLVEFSIAPHYRSAHPDAELIERLVAYFEAHAMPFRPCAMAKRYSAQTEPRRPGRAVAHGTTRVRHGLDMHVANPLDNAVASPISWR